MTSRGPNPREKLSREDMVTLRELRRDIYKNSITGGFFGMGSGLVLHTAAQWARKFGVTKVKLNRNTLMLSVLGGGAFGMFLFASSKGKEQVYKLHPMFQVGAMPKGGLDYSTKVQQAQLPPSDQVDASKRQSSRTVRRETVLDNIEHDKGGFSDAPGGQWYRDDDVDMEKLKDVRAAR